MIIFHHFNPVQNATTIAAASNPSTISTPPPPLNPRGSLVDMQRLDGVPGQVEGGQRPLQRLLRLEDVVDGRRTRAGHDVDRPEQVHVHPDEAVERLAVLRLGRGRGDGMYIEAAASDWYETVWSRKKTDTRRKSSQASSTCTGKSTVQNGGRGKVQTYDVRELA